MTPFRRACAPTSTSASRPGTRATVLRSSRSTRSSATISSRPLATGTSSASRTQRSARVRASGSPPPGAAPSGGATTPPRPRFWPALRSSCDRRASTWRSSSTSRASSRARRRPRRSPPRQPNVRWRTATSRERRRRGSSPRFHGMMSGQGSPDELEALALEAIPLLEQRSDHACLVHVWYAVGFGVANARGQYAEWARAAEQALVHARLAGQRPTHLYYLDLVLILGPTPADEALETLDALMPEGAHPHPQLLRSVLLAMLGRFDEAGPLAKRGERATARARAGSRRRQLHPGRDRPLRGRHRGRCTPPRDVLRLPLRARAAARCCRPSHRSTGVGSVRPDASTRRSPRRSSAGNSVRSTTSRRRRSGDRCRLASTRTAAATPRLRCWHGRRSR